MTSVEDRVGRHHLAAVDSPNLLLLLSSRLSLSRRQVRLRRSSVAGACGGATTRLKTLQLFGAPSWPRGPPSADDTPPQSSSTSYRAAGFRRPTTDDEATARKIAGSRPTHDECGRPVGLSSAAAPPPARLITCSHTVSGPAAADWRAGVARRPMA